MSLQRKVKDSQDLYFNKKPHSSLISSAARFCRHFCVGKMYISKTKMRDVEVVDKADIANSFNEVFVTVSSEITGLMRISMVLKIFH